MFTKLVTGVCVTAAITVGTVGIVGIVAPGAAGAQSTPTCSATQLAPHFGMSQGAAGTLQDTWRLRNISPHTCKVSGLATVVNYGSDGRPLRMDVTPMSSGPAHVVVLTSGQHASFDLRYTNPAIVGCQAEHPAEMTIQWPGAARPVIVQNGLPSCHGRASESFLRHGN